jgi:4-hydroxy-2-oxoheptanedioate aldolase
MENLILKKLRGGNKLYGAMFQTGSVAATECLGIAGLDFMVIDTEHSTFRMDGVSSFVIAAERRGIAPLVRIGGITRESVLSALDMGAKALVVPGVKEADEVKLLVEYGKYPPLGSRGFCFTRTSAFGNDPVAGDVESYFALSNEENLILPQCETLGCLEHIEQIVNIDGVDGIFFGPYDLSVALGRPADFDTAEFGNAVSRVLNACLEAGKLSIIFASELERARRYLAMGFDGVVLGTDVAMLINAYQTAITELRTGQSKAEGGIDPGQTGPYANYLGRHK